MDLIYSTFMNSLWAKVHLDVVKMLACKGKYFIVQAKKHLSGWIEARAIAKNDSKIITKFIHEDIFCRHNIFRSIIINNGFENKKEVTELLKKHDIKKI